MRSGFPRTLWLPLAFQFLALGLPSKSQENFQQPDVEIEGLHHEYPSCGLVEFSVRNTSSQKVHVEAYAEEFKSNEWTYVDYTYDLTDPRSLYIKRVMVNPDMMQTGSSLNVKYDRCLKPSFIKETKGAFTHAIKERDKKATSPVLQRLRVDVYILDQGHLKRIQHARSQVFERVPEKQPEQPKRGNSSSPD